jgi:hypothetical protein
MAGVTDARALTEPMVQSAAALDGAFGRGEGYVQYVRGLRIVAATAHATIQARNVYLVEIDWSNGDLVGECTCPHAARGAFCKHQVAVALCVVDRLPAAEQPAVADPDRTLVEALPQDALRALVLDLMARDRAVQHLVELRAAAYTGDGKAATEQLVELTNDALRARGFVDYRRSFEVARGAEELLDQLDAELDASGADVVRPALLRALNRLQKITLNGDDSAGVLGGACQRALDLYARSCREGTPDRAKLARWLVKFRDESPGWPQATLEDFVAAFDDRALEVYRRAVAKVDEDHRGDDHWGRFEVDRMRLELADHDGDVRLAVEILGTGEHPSYGAVVERLRAAGRAEEAVAWMDRAVAAGRVSGRSGGNDYWLSPHDVAGTYLGVGRIDDALAVLHREFATSAGVATFRSLIDFATPLGRAEDERTWALETARELATRPYGTGAALVEIALHEKDLDAAWAAADEYGAGHLWQPLADASVSTYPRRAADLYRPGLVEDLRYPDTGKYAGIADRLARMRDLYVAAGDSADFDQLMAQIRADYGRRPSLMAALDRRALP